MEIKRQKEQEENIIFKTWKKKKKADNKNIDHINQYQPIENIHNYNDYIPKENYDQKIINNNQNPPEHKDIYMRPKLEDWNQKQQELRSQQREIPSEYNKIYRKILSGNSNKNVLKVIIIWKSLLNAGKYI